MEFIYICFYIYIWNLALAFKSVRIDDTLRCTCKAVFSEVVGGIS